MSKFKVGDKVTGVNKHQVLFGVEDTIMDYKTVPGLSGYTLSDNFGIWHDFELKLVQPQTEFTFQEVIARIKPGEKYIQSSKVGKDYHEFGISISLKEKNDIVIEFFKDGKEYTASTFFVGFSIEPNTRFKLDDKKKYTVYTVEFKKAGPLCFKYVSNQELELYTFVNVGDSNKYARVIGKETVEMTEEEYKQMKECWEA